MKNAFQLGMILTILMAAGNKDRLSQEFQSNLDNRKVKVLPGAIAIRKEVSPSSESITNLINAQTQKVQGVSDIDGNKLDPNSAFVVTGIRFGYDVSQTSSGKESELPYAGNPNSIKHAQLVVKDEGRLLFSMPLSEIYNPYTGNSRQDDVYNLPTAFVLAGNRKLDIDIEWALGATPDGTNKEYVEVVFHGFDARSV